MLKLSANLGLLWSELSLVSAIRAAARAGFDAVECHFPYEVEPVEVAEVLAETGLTMIALNTRRDLSTKQETEFGLGALPARVADARSVIDEAVAYAAAVGCRNVHVLAGVARGSDARKTFIDNLRYAASVAAAVGRDGPDVLIEPLNTRDSPGYFLTEVEQAAAIIADVAAPNVGIMFDCYHVQIGQGDLVRRFEEHIELIRHVQFAAVPSRGEPDEGEVDYAWLLPTFEAAGYRGHMGAEYHPTTDTDDSLGWMRSVAGKFDRIPMVDDETD